MGVQPVLKARAQAADTNQSFLYAPKGSNYCQTYALAFQTLPSPLRTSLQHPKHRPRTQHHRHQPHGVEGGDHRDAELQGLGGEAHFGEAAGGVGEDGGGGWNSSERADDEADACAAEQEHAGAGGDAEEESG